MNFVDMIIIIILILGLIVGCIRGFLPQLVSLLGFFMIIVGSFMLKSPFAQFLYEKLPFFQFAGILKGVTIINILLYEVLAFVILMIAFSILFKIVLKLSKLIEKMLEKLVILTIPSKILGAVLGVIENYLVVIIVLYILSLPFFNMEIIKDSKLRQPILEKTPILNRYVDKTVDAGEELWNLIELYQTGTDANAFNLDALDVLLKYNIISIDSIDKLIERNKLSIDGIDKILVKYRKNDRKITSTETE